jgi:hypothetical protein
MKKILAIFGVFFYLTGSLYCQDVGVQFLHFGMDLQEVSRVLEEDFDHANNEPENPWYSAENLSDGTAHILLEITREDGLVGYRIQRNPMTYDQAKDICSTIVNEFTNNYGIPRITTNNSGMLITTDPQTRRTVEYGRPVYYEWNIERNRGGFRQWNCRNNNYCYSKSNGFSEIYCRNNIPKYDTV